MPPIPPLPFFSCSLPPLNPLSYICFRLSLPLSSFHPFVSTFNFPPFLDVLLPFLPLPLVLLLSALSSILTYLFCRGVLCKMCSEHRLKLPFNPYRLGFDLRRLARERFVKDVRFPTRDDCGSSKTNIRRRYHETRDTLRDIVESSSGKESRETRQLQHGKTEQESRST